MVSLQLLQLTQDSHCHTLLASRRKALLLATGLLVAAGGAAAYANSRFTHRKSNYLSHHHRDYKDTNDPSHANKLAGQKKRGSQSLRVLAAILLSEIGKNGARDLLALVALTVIRTAFSNRLAKVQGFLFRAAFLRRVPLFLQLISENILVCFFLSTLHSTSKYITGALSLRFRNILTKHMHKYYFENMAYYKISHVDSRITNPEQRIVSDIPKLCSELSELVQDDMTAVADSLLYTWRLCSYASPKYVLWILAYVLGAGTLIRKLSPSFGKLLSKEQQLEGEYRQLHSRLRTHAESIAFYGGENREEHYIHHKFKTLIRHMRTVLHDYWWFGMIQDFLVKYLGATVAVVLIIEPFFSGNLRPDTSTLGRAEMLSNLRYHSSVIISLFQSLGTLSTSSRRLNRLSGYADRIHELMAISKELAVGEKSLQRSPTRNYFSEADFVEFSDVKVVTPTGNVLVEDLTLKVERGSNLLVTGPNGSGKSSLFRVLGGLWPLVSGHIVKPGVGSDLNKEIFYVPQRPYTAYGTLRDQLIYPFTADQEVEPLTHDGIVELLKNVDLEYLLVRYPPDKEINWGDELSLGEQQRLGMARLFYHKPKFAILDECTSAVTTNMEERFCAKVRDMGTSCITISHRPALVAFHDVILSLDGEGGWSVHYKRNDLAALPEAGINTIKPSDTYRQCDAMVVQHAFSVAEKDSDFSNAKGRSYISEVIRASPSMNHSVSLPTFPQLQSVPRALQLRVAAMFKVLVSEPVIRTSFLISREIKEAPTVLDKQGAQLLAVAFLVVSRTWISDRIATLNGTAMRFVLEQDKASFIRLIGISILQSAANSFVAPSLRHLTARLALGWRIRLTKHLLKSYLRNNAFYKVFTMSSKKVDADQRITHDLEKLTGDLSGLVTGMVKPSVDIMWFTWRMKLLIGQRGVAILYVYMFLGLGFLRNVAPDFGNMTSREQQLEGSFRFMHERLCTHAESVAFFGGGAREKAMIESRFRELLDHSLTLMKKKWLFGIFDDFVTKQLPHNVTWGLSFLYAMEHKGDRSLITTQGELAHALRYLAYVVSQSFMAFGDILELHRKFLELSGSINRVFELEELLDASQSGTSPKSDIYSSDGISFVDVDIITPAHKLLAKRLTCEVRPGKSLLVTGPNGSGKSSVFRVLKGLWPVVSGRLTKPSVSECNTFYVPQRPYTCLGTLRDQIIYPLSQNEAELRVVKLYNQGNEFDHSTVLDTHLKTIIENVRLSYLLVRDENGWDAILNWDDVLSLGEQQRLGMARLFFHKPKFGILDECTNATSVDVEEQLYILAKDMGITVVTSSQRPALIPYHSLELRFIDGEGNWEIHSIKH
ncbi:hypothetical protein ACFE04_017576 [Oxalis oulophora]